MPRFAGWGIDRRRFDRRRLRTGLRLGLPNDPISRRGYRTAMKVQILGVSAAVLMTPFLPDVSRSDRATLVALGFGVVVAIAALVATLGRRDPRAAWCTATVIQMAVVLTVMLAVPDAYVAGLLASAIVVAATTAIGGLGIGLLAAVAAALTALVGSVVAPGEPGSVALGAGMAVIAYPIIVLSIDGFTLSRHRTATQLARLHETLQSVSAAPSLPETLDALVSAVYEAFGADSAVVLLRDGDHLELGAPSGRSAPWWTDEKIARLSAKELASNARSPLNQALRTGRTIVVRDVAAEKRFPRWAEQWQKYVGAEWGLASMVFVPLRRATEAIGVVHVSFRRPGALDSAELALLEAYAEQASTVILRAQAYAQLEAADSLKAEFLATVSHELRTPLTAAKGFVDTVLLQWDRIDDAERRLLLERASGNADQLARLIDQLLAYARLDGGGIRLLPVPTLLRPLVDDVVARLAPVLDDHVVHVDVDPELLVDIDRDAAMHVLENLLTNAANFSAPGTLVGVTAVVEGEAVVVSVHDSGIGIAVKEQVRIFERFHRVGDAAGAPRGTGVGLAIVERFVDAMGGRVWVESAPGLGSVFSFTVPAAGVRGAADGVVASVGHVAPPKRQYS
jgi:signal transduction histidine kinase